MRLGNLVTKDRFFCRFSVLIRSCSRRCEVVHSDKCRDSCEPIAEGACRVISESCRVGIPQQYQRSCQIDEPASKLVYIEQPRHYGWVGDGDGWYSTHQAE